MAVPAHDQRDFEFATKYKLPILPVIKNSHDEVKIQEATIEKNVLINSGEFDGLNFDDAFQAIEKKATALNCGYKETNFRLRDWGVSRQRYGVHRFQFLVMVKKIFMPKIYLLNYLPRLNSRVSVLH